MWSSETTYPNALKLCILECECGEAGKSEGCSRSFKFAMLEKSIMFECVK